MPPKIRSDRLLLVATVALVATGLVMVYSASAVLALRKSGEPQLFLIRQGLWTALGAVGLAVAMRVDYRVYRNATFLQSAYGVVTVLLVAVFFRGEVKGAHRWIGVGGLGIQPSELAKLVCVLVTASILERRMHRIHDAQYALLPIAVAVGAMAGLILLEPDFGATVSILAVVGVMVFVAGLRIRHLAVGTIVAVPILIWLVLGSEYRRRRFEIFLDPWSDPYGGGYHIIQALIAVGSGGLWGKGVMGGVQKLFYLPEPYTDFVFAVAAEELGLAGATAVLACFVVIAWRGLRITMRATDAFGAFVALGLTGMIVVQALINLSVVLNLLPTKGIALPLVSYGGSSLLVTMTAVGILLNIARRESAEGGH